MYYGFTLSCKYVSCNYVSFKNFVDEYGLEDGTTFI